MSLYDYHISREIAAQDYPFHALIMAAARKADTFNYEALKLAFPGTVTEVELRYNAPGGRLPHEMEIEEEANG